MPAPAWSATFEIIEDYPSHYSAHNRRKHRWLRGDWQIAEWLRPLVPEESGHKVPNPLSVVSRWKILDNLRRSMVEPALFPPLACWDGSVLPGRAWALDSCDHRQSCSCPHFVQLAIRVCKRALQGKLAGAVDALERFSERQRFGLVDGHVPRAPGAVVHGCDGANLGSPHDHAPEALAMGDRSASGT